MEAIPCEMWQVIAGHASPESRNALRKTCREMRTLLIPSALNTIHENHVPPLFISDPKEFPFHVTGLFLTKDCSVPLKPLGHITHIEVCADDFSPNMLKLITRCPHLKSLRMLSSNLKDIDLFRILESCQELEEVDLSGATQLTRAGVQKIAELPRLKTVYLACLRVTPAFFRALPSTIAHISLCRAFFASAPEHEEALKTITRKQCRLSTLFDSGMDIHINVLTLLENQPYLRHLGLCFFLARNFEAILNPPHPLESVIAYHETENEQYAALKGRVDYKFGDTIWYLKGEEEHLSDIRDERIARLSLWQALGNGQKTLPSLLPPRAAAL